MPRTDPASDTTARRFETEADEIRHVLRDLETWAVVGCSPDPGRASHEVAAFLRAKGKRIVPVNPAEGRVLGERCYPDLASAVADGIEVDVVDVFRRSSQAGAHVDEAIDAGAAAVWLQLGVIDLDAGQRARAASLLFVMDRCPKIEWPRLVR
jgi:predicted CoA-binding protein